MDYAELTRVRRLFNVWRKDAPYAAWVAARSRKTVVAREGTVLYTLPSSAELKRWLRAKDTPRYIKHQIYSQLLYRRHQS